jgi:type II secretory pathway predicted ATPase ExeA
MYRQRFGLTGHPLAKNAQGKTYFDKSPGYLRFEKAFGRLSRDPGLGVLTAEAGVGKTAAIRNLCARRPRPDYLVLYFCDTAVSPLDLYRALAAELGVRPSHRRAQLWTDIKKMLAHIVDERGTTPIVVIDEAQHLSDRFLVDLSGFLNFAFDSRELLTLWLVGLPTLDRTLRMQQHAPLRMRVGAQIHLEPLDRDTFAAAVDHGLRAVGAQAKLIADSALELCFRASRGVLRTAARILRTALAIAHDREQSFVDDHVMEAAVDEVAQPRTVTP